jgi:hypothetical protein
MSLFLIETCELAQSHCQCQWVSRMQSFLCLSVDGLLKTPSPTQLKMAKNMNALGLESYTAEKDIIKAD